MAFPSDSARTKNWGTETLTDSDLEGQLDLLHTYFKDALNASTGHNHDGTSNQGPKLTPANLVIASQAQGDILYASSATAWARLGAGTSGQFLKTNGAAANPSWATAGVMPHARHAMYVMQASTTTITVAPGSVEINGAIVTKTTNTTLTISTAGDWAGGSSLRATNTTAYVGIDSAGNIKMHTTAPSHADYALSITAANNTKRYASWSSTTYRIIGWFRMNATGSGELDVYGVSNIADGAIKNTVFVETTATATGTGTIPLDNTRPQNTEGDEYMSASIVPTNVNNRITIETILFYSNSSALQQTTALFQDTTADALKSVGVLQNGADAVMQAVLDHNMKAGTTSYTTFKVRSGGNVAGTTRINGQGGAQVYNGAAVSYIKITEEETQLT